MARRELSSSVALSTSGRASAVSRLPMFWDLADTTPKTEWEEWWDLFMVAANDKCSISVNEILKIVTEQNPRVLALLNNLNE